MGFRFSYELLVSDSVAAAISFYELPIAKICTEAILDAVKTRIEATSVSQSLKPIPNIVGVAEIGKEREKREELLDEIADLKKALRHVREKHDKAIEEKEELEKSLRSPSPRMKRK